MGLEGKTEPYLEGEITALGTYKARSEMKRVSLDVLHEPFQLIMVGLGSYIAFRFLFEGRRVRCVNAATRTARSRQA